MNVKVALGVKPRYAKKVGVDDWGLLVPEFVIAVGESSLRATLNAGSPAGSDPKPTIVSVPLPLAAAGMVIDAMTVPARTVAVAAEVPMLTVADVGTVGWVALGNGRVLALPQPTPTAISARAIA